MISLIIFHWMQTEKEMMLHQNDGFVPLHQITGMVRTTLLTCHLAPLLPSPPIAPWSCTSLAPNVTSSYAPDTSSDKSAEIATIFALKLKKTKKRIILENKWWQLCQIWPVHKQKSHISCEIFPKKGLIYHDLQIFSHGDNGSFDVNDEKLQ